MKHIEILNNDTVQNGGTLVILVGPPGSGKSFFAEEIVKNVDNYIIVSPDKIREELFGDASDQSHNNELFSKVYDDIVSYLSQGYNVVYDATNCRTLYRTKVVDACKDYTYRILCLVASTTLNDCFKRNESRDRYVPEQVIERMYFTLRKHPPTTFEGYDIIATF